MLLSQFVPPCPSPLCVHKTIFSVSVSIATLQIGSSVPYTMFPQFGDGNITLPPASSFFSLPSHLSP